jgi:sugar lactone lactonase YvrE
MTGHRCTTVTDGLAFPEAPRWRAGRLWFTDQHARAVLAVDPAGRLETIAATDDLPGGLGWLPDGRLLVVLMTRRRVMRLSGAGLTEHADLSGTASFHCNDMVVDAAGRAYVGNFGFDLHGGAQVAPAEIVLVGADGSVEVFARDAVFPNGSAITPSGDTLLVAETFAHRVSAFGLDAEGRVSSRRVWADLGEHTPDGVCLDAEGALWVASPGTRALIRVRQGGAVLERCATRGTPYACMLGGEDRRTLYVCTAETDDPREAARRRSGRIEQVRVGVPGAGLP